MANTEQSENSITIRRGDSYGPASQHYITALGDYLETLPDFANLKGPKMGGPDSPRPHHLPAGSVMLYATQPGAEEHSIGSLCLMPLRKHMPQFRGLEAEAAEIKRMIVFPEQRGKGVARALIAEAEMIAKAETGAQLMVVETLWLLDGAQALYRAAGFRERDVWGGYVREDSVCFEKWL